MTSLPARLVLLVLLFSGAAVPARASHRTIAHFQPGYARSDNVAGGDFGAGAHLTMVGKVREFAAEFPEQVDDSVVEYTFTITNAVCDSGTSIDPSIDPDRFTHWSEFSGGRITIFRDETPDASFSYVDTFQDGTVVLTGDFSRIWIWVEVTPAGLALGNVVGLFRFKGGTQFGGVNEQGVGYQGTVDGSFEFRGANLPPNLLDLGYFGGCLMNFYSLDAVPVKSTTWTRIKTLMTPQN